MPIYEFYCPDCDTLYNFFSSRIDTEARPDCPRCGHEKLERKPARFAAITRGSGGGEDVGDDLGVDEELLGAAFESALGEMETSGADAEDPRQMARLFRRVGEAAGLQPGDRMDEMLRRLEAGEDPERLEEEMGDAFDDEADRDDDADPLADLFRRKRRRGRRKPRVDPELHFL